MEPPPNPPTRRKYALPVCESTIYKTPPSATAGTYLPFSVLKDSMRTGSRRIDSALFLSLQALSSTAIKTQKKTLLIDHFLCVSKIYPKVAADAALIDQT